jgi:CAAX protease family protein
MGVVKRAQTPGALFVLPNNFIRRFPSFSYFVLAYAISWLGAFLVASPCWLRGEAAPKMAGLMMFPATLLGPTVAGATLTAATQGRAGLRSLLSRMRRLGSYAWCVTLLIPPALVLSVLLGLKTYVSPVFAPNRFWIGFLFGCAAGLFEEIGWTGFAFPAMRVRQSAMRAGIWLGFLWALWHAPVIDYLGAATPHGRYWLLFFLAFAVAMTAVRMLICWIYSNTNSVLLAQMFHASSTGALAAFSPSRVTAGEEVMWYPIYGVILWMIVGIIIARYGPTLTKADRNSGRT